MKNTFFYIIIYFFCIINTTVAQTDSDTSTIYFNEEEGLTLDLLYKKVYDPKISYEDKMNTIYNCSYFISDAQKEKQLAVFNKIITDGKEIKNYDGILYGYITLALLNLAWNNLNEFNSYIDTAEIYVDKAKNAKALSSYYYYKGYQNFNIPYGQKKAYMYYEKALESLDKSDASDERTRSLIYNIVGDLSIKPDPTFMKRIASKVEKFLNKKYDATVDFYLCLLKSDLYKCYFDTNKQEATLDSAIYYYQKLINLYYDKEKGISKIYETHDVAQGYLFIAEYYSLKEKPDWTYIKKCIDKVNEIRDTTDTYVTCKLHFTEAIYEYGLKNYAKAEENVKMAEQLINKIYNEDVMFAGKLILDEIKNADLHSKILYAQQKDKEAFEYNKLKNDLKYQMQSDETRELEFQYNTEKEEQNIEKLKNTNSNQRKSTTMFIAIAILLIATIGIQWTWFYTARNNLSRRFSLLKAEKEETELNLKIKEEQAIKAQLDKYEVLSDYRLKEIELEGKNKAWKQLLEDKNDLDKKIKTYINKINKYENENEKNNKEEKSEKTLLDISKEDLTKLINKRLANKKEYIETLGRIDKTYISSLKNEYDGNLSIPYIKYCISFAIGMTIGDISECFSIEQTSVHMIRYRLKKKFGLNNNDDLDMYLKRLNNDSISKHRSLIIDDIKNWGKTSSI